MPHGTLKFQIVFWALRPIFTKKKLECKLNIKKHIENLLIKNKNKKPSIPFYWESAKQIPIYNDLKDDLWNLNLSYVNPRQK
jgi:hypothetical protein